MFIRVIIRIKTIQEEEEKFLANYGNLLKSLNLLDWVAAIFIWYLSYVDMH